MARAISALDAAIDPAVGDLVELEQAAPAAGSKSRRLTLSALRDFFLVSVPAWSFGSGDPSNNAGKANDYYVDVQNRLWSKTGSSGTAWVYTGIQYGSVAGVAAVSTLADTDALAFGSNANGLQTRRITAANVRTWIRGWLTKADVGLGNVSNLAPADLPVSTATANALALKTDKAYRPVPAGQADTQDTSNWFSVGTITFGLSGAAKITVLGTQGYADTEPASGETLIYLRRTNDSQSIGITGHFYGNSQGNSTAAFVAVLRTADSTWRVYVKAAAYSSTAAMADTNGVFVPENINSGSATIPSGAILLPSMNYTMVNGSPVTRVNGDGLDLVKGGFRQGPDGPRTAKKLLRGRMPATAGGTVQVPLGVSADLIVGLTTLVRYDNSGSAMGPNADGPTLPASFYRFRYWLGPSVINLQIDNGEGSALLDQPFRVLLEYLVE